DALPVYVVARQWMWKFQHPEGQREINQLHVPRGRAVKLLQISEDVIHSFFVPEFRLHMDVLPERYTSVWFEATKTGTFHLFCSRMTAIFGNRSSSQEPRSSRATKTSCPTTGVSSTKRTSSSSLPLSGPWDEARRRRAWRIRRRRLPLPRSKRRRNNHEYRNR